MTLTAKDVAQITRLLEASNFDELTLELDGLKLSVRRNGAPACGSPGDEARPAPAQAAQYPAEPPVRAAFPAAPASAPVADAAGASTREVAAPLLGTFYRAPKPGAPPFIDIGSVVEEQTIIGIIEVMKLMNTVRAGVRGTVVEVLAQDGVLVEYGQTLVRVRKATSA